MLPKAEVPTTPVVIIIFASPSTLTETFPRVLTKPFNDTTACDSVVTVPKADVAN
jgi:hypothetical protein